MKLLSSLPAALILAAFSIASCAPIHIAMDTKDEDGSRIVVTSGVDLASYNGGTVSMALGTRISGRDTVVAVLVLCDTESDHGIFGKGNRFMMRFSDGSEVSLANFFSNEYDTSMETGTTSTPVHSWGYDYVYSPYTGNVFLTPYNMTAMVPQTYVYKKTNSYALYPVNKDQLIAMMNKECVKLRIETEDNEVNVINPSALANEVKEMFGVLAERARKGVKRTEF